MNTRTIKHFLALADTLHFGRASEECNISISALSRNIRQLEEEVGVALFNRDNRMVALTLEGEKFLAYAREASSQWNLIRHELTDNSDQLHGEISLYCSVTASYSFLFDLLNRFRIAHPGIEIKLHTGDPEHAVSRILDGKEDITIAAKPANVAHGLVFKHITVSPLLFIAPAEQHVPNVPTHPPTTAKQWANVPMILSEGGVSRNRVDTWFRKLDITPTIYAQVTGNEAIVSMVSLGFGIGVVPKIVLDNSPLVDRIKVLDVQPELEPYDIGLFTLKKSLKNPMVNAFWSLMSEENKQA
ncbi:HTH-type transcriptional activator IlvY [Neptunomonas phycophila]|jgi:LysR family positive regulator for ilvC|uniref:HTH-type transcriptional activator IlvY n=1 Tax=Neptunomonas phycophila TaxID=1572645 RepID=UPI0015B7EEC2|nr:HTH-type transcriptional activator IlvY [Neptunomonas phycophila]QLE98412.1 HTH-type transcriptional activator IlvY [Neptunomonas phycophila]